MVFAELRMRTFEQALCMWKWNEYLNSLIQAGKTPRNINLAERNIQLWPPRHRGNIAFRKWPSLRKVRSKFCSKVSLKESRSSITHVAMVCDRTEMQSRLPQFLLVSEKRNGIAVQKQFEKILHDRLLPFLTRNTGPLWRSVRKHFCGLGFYNFIYICFGIRALQMAQRRRSSQS